MRLAFIIVPGVAVLERCPAKVAVSGGELIHRVQQVKHFGDRVGAQIKVLTYQLNNNVIA